MARRKTDDAAPRTEAEAEERRNDLEGQYLDQMQALFEERQAVNGKIAELTKAVSQAGLSPKVIKAVTKRRLESEEEAEDRRSFESQRDDLLARIGAFVTTPLGQAAVSAHH